MAIPTQSPTMLDHVEAAFHRASRAPGVLVVDGHGLGPEVPDRRLPLTELRPLLLHSATSFDKRDRALGAVVAATRRDPEPWALGLAWLHLPGLRLMATRLAHAGADPEEADAEMVAGGSMPSATGQSDPTGSRRASAGTRTAAPGTTSA